MRARQTTWRRLVGAASLPVLGLVWSAPAAADPGDACVTAYEQAQQLRRGGKLLQSRAELHLCQRACPTLLAEDCDRWLPEVDAAVPTVILSAKDHDGKDLAAVRVLVDGAPLATRLDGSPVEVDPGEHLFRFERDATQGVEAKATLRERERGRRVGVTFERAVVVRRAARPPVLAYILGGAGAAAVGVGAVLGIKGQIDRARLEKDCAPLCKKGDVADIRAEWWIAGISAGAGVALVGVAGLVWFTAPAEPSAVSLGLSPLAGGGLARIAGAF